MGKDAKIKQARRDAEKVRPDLLAEFKAARDEYEAAALALAKCPEMEAHDKAQRRVTLADASIAQAHKLKRGRDQFDDETGAIMRNVGSAR